MTSEEEPFGAAASSTRAGLPWVRLVLVGVLAGFTSGLFGVGGGVVMVPALVAVAGLDHKLATGTSLTAIVPIAVSATLGYATAGELDWSAALVVTVGALVGTVLGTMLLRRVRVGVLQYLFASLMLATAVRMLFEESAGDGRGEFSVAMVFALALTGVGAGLLAGLFGVGGGIVMVPALTLGLGMPLALAKGTSLAVIVPAAVLGTVRNRAVGLTALGSAAVVGAAGVASAFLASQLSVGLDERLAASLFAVLLTVVALRMAGTAWAARPRRAGEADSVG